MVNGLPRIVGVWREPNASVCASDRRGTLRILRPPTIFKLWMKSVLVILRSEILSPSESKSALVCLNDLFDMVLARVKRFRARGGNAARKKDAYFAKTCLYFADFALKFFDYFLGFQRFYLQSVKLAWCAYLEFDNVFQSFDGTVFCASA